VTALPASVFTHLEDNSISATMRDIDHASVGSDYYFDKALQYPEFSPSSPHARKCWYQATDSSLHVYLQDSSIGGGISYVKDIRDSPTRSEGTGETSQSTLDDDLDSHCGSLTYSVESWGLGQMLPDKDVQGNINIEIVDLPSTLNTEDSTEQNVFDPCFRPLAWVVSLLQESFKKKSSSLDEMKNADDYDL
jgi:hypothetical protein